MLKKIFLGFKYSCFFCIFLCFSPLYAAMYISFTPISLAYQASIESENTNLRGVVKTTDHYFSYDASFLIGYKFPFIAVHASLGGYGRIIPSISRSVAQESLNRTYTIIRTLGLRFGGGATIYLPFTFFIRPNIYWATKLFVYNGVAADISFGISLPLLKLFALEIYVKYLYEQVFDNCNCTIFNTNYTDHIVNLGVGLAFY